MKLLAVSSRPPWPPTMADAMTVDRLLRFLVGRGHSVDLACQLQIVGVFRSRGLIRLKVQAVFVSSSLDKSSRSSWCACS